MLLLGPLSESVSLTILLPTRGGRRLEENPYAYNVIPEEARPVTPSGQYVITAESDFYLISGTSAGLRVARKLVSAIGSYAITGTDVTLIYTPVSGVKRRYLNLMGVGS